MSNQPAVVIEGLGVQYRAVKALDGVSLTLEAGKLLALLGPNGAGKTTLLSAMLGLVKPNRGSLALFGQRPGSLAARSLTGVMLQNSGVPELLSVAELVELFASYHLDPMTPDQAMTRAGIEALARRRFGSLSGGQKQQVLFALAIVGRPRLLLLDEPSNGMDLQARARLWQTVQSLRDAGTAVLLTTHYIEEADRLADEVVLLDRGRVLASDAPAQIKSRLSGSEMRFATRLDQVALSELLAGTDFELSGGRCRLLSTQPERLLARLLHADPDLAELEVRPTSLEDALSALTLEQAA
ncbi:MAG: ABC transporter ATP-binding protein [Wenzhouxiangella sp.]|nr:ABC transporter ATP-binding protein [Wenzhouxiangella sp.]MCH8477837.1 ABC transporter ATP-binding protein [Wenzhouxiangella sp.]TVR98988.1 MAG: ABC transporter ATP-binding protein [Wenzhouxiangellaceae bacterium]